MRLTAAALDGGRCPGRPARASAIVPAEWGVIPGGARRPAFRARLQGVRPSPSLQGATSGGYATNAIC